MGKKGERVVDSGKRERVGDSGEEKGKDVVGASKRPFELHESGLPTIRHAIALWYLLSLCSQLQHLLG